MTIMDSIKAELDEYKHVVREQMARITDLEGQVQRLTAAADAYTALRAVWTDPSASQATKVRAAAAAIGYERPKIMPVPPVIELSEDYEPLAVVVERQRARLNLLLGPGTDQASPERSDKVLDLEPVSSRNGND